MKVPDYQNDCFLDVALPLPPVRTFTYKISKELVPTNPTGCRVVVPFGTRQLTGFVVGVENRHNEIGGVEITKIKRAVGFQDSVPLVTTEILGIAKWASDYYRASLGEMLKGTFPSGLNPRFVEIFSIGTKNLDSPVEPVGKKAAEILEWLRENGPSDLDELKRLFGSSARTTLAQLCTADLAVSDFAENPGLKGPMTRRAARLSGLPVEGTPTKQQARILTILESANEGLLLTNLCESAGTGMSPIKTLATRGVIEIFAKEVRRDPLRKSEKDVDVRHELDAQQTASVNKVSAALDSGDFKTFLLHGVTGSGKTEVYFNLIEQTLSRGKSSIMLVPEIALTPVFSKKLRARFGDEIAILHSSLADGERHDEWHRIRRGEARIVIGTRSAIFSPVRDLGLLIVDEEHDGSYRQQESPFYNARDLAVVRGSLEKAVIVLGSATPSMETYENARNGKYVHLEMDLRVAGRPMASVEIIDMRDEFKIAGKDVVFSRRLIEELRKNKSRGEQAMVLLNRRGFSQFVLCRTCGESIKCVNCDISLTYHRRSRSLLCHYCNHREKVPDSCPKCSGTYLYFIGEGTEQIEAQLQKMMPELKIARVDRDTASRRYEVENILQEFKSGAIDILVGTQMIAKGHDFPGVTLVGVVSVDTGLGLPDFRSSERTFQLLTQVAGRAGRGEKEGHVLIQTYYPEHYVLRHAAKQDYKGFFEEEIRFRRNLAYPPFTALASLLIKNKSQEKAESIAQDLRNILNQWNSDNRCRILGPAPAPLARIKDEYRIQIVVKSDSRKALRTLIDRVVDDAEQRKLEMRAVTIEIDPISLL